MIKGKLPQATTDKSISLVESPDIVSLNHIAFLLPLSLSPSPAYPPHLRRPSRAIN